MMQLLTYKAQLSRKRLLKQWLPHPAYHMYRKRYMTGKVTEPTIPINPSTCMCIIRWWNNNMVKWCRVQHAWCNIHVALFGQQARHLLVFKQQQQFLSVAEQSFCTSAVFKACQPINIYQWCDIQLTPGPASAKCTEGEQHSKAAFPVHTHMHKARSRLAVQKAQ
jgi:hypothetical protein